MWWLYLFRFVRRLAWLCLLLIIVAGLAAPAHAANELTFRFPWDSEQKLRFSGGPHEWQDDVWSGIDFSSGSTSTPILAMADGKVKYIDDEDCKNGKCKTVKIEHDGGWETWYVHLSDYAPKLKKDEEVLQGQWIGNEGSTGATNVHIHIELWKDGKPATWNGEIIEGWTVQTDCDNYDKDKNKTQPKLKCDETEYNGYFSNDTVHMLPNQGSPQYSVASSNKALPAALLRKVVVPESLKPGEQSAVTLRLENIGPIDWPMNGSVTLVNVNDEPLGSTSRQLKTDVKRSGSVDWVLEITTPPTAGTYESVWKIARDGQPVGEPFVFMIVVAGSDQPIGWFDRLRKLLLDFWNRVVGSINETVKDIQRRAAERVEEAKRQAIERAQEEARRAIERQLRALCGVAPAAVLMVGSVVFIRERRRKRRL
jgi:murein DD-endopeptidase MepM/ murein hydrolase activator NlpD